MQIKKYSTAELVELSKAYNARVKPKYAFSDHGDTLLGLIKRGCFELYEGALPFLRVGFTETKSGRDEIFELEWSVDIFSAQFIFNDREKHGIHGLFFRATVLLDNKAYNLMGVLAAGPAGHDGSFISDGQECSIANFRLMELVGYDGVARLLALASIAFVKQGGVSEMTLADLADSATFVFAAPSQTFYKAGVHTCFSADIFLGKKRYPLTAIKDASPVGFAAVEAVDGRLTDLLYVLGGIDGVARVLKRALDAARKNKENIIEEERCKSKPTR